MTDNQRALLDQEWYYSIELSPGVITPGRFGRPTLMVRRLLDTFEVRGRSCLDIGPMEALIATVLAKRGARVTAFDVTAEHVRKIEAVKKAHGVEFEMIAPLALADAPQRLGRFDVVVFGGILYHTLDLISPLLHVRSLARTGGAVVVESWLDGRDGMAAHFNAGGAFTPERNTYWFATVPLFDYLLRLAGLAPVDCRYWYAPSGGTLRLAALCRVMPTPVARGQDEWIAGTLHGADYNRIMNSAPPDPGGPEVLDPSRGVIDLAHHVATVPPAEFNREESILRL